MQDFGSDWDWFIKNVLPVLQLVMTLIGAALGAGIGGWVAIKTTTRALEAASERERVAREEARKAARVEILRGHAERYVALLWKVFEFQADLLSDIVMWANGHKVRDDGGLPELEPPSGLFAEMRALEILHLEVMDGTAFSLGDRMQPFFNLNAETIMKKGNNVVEWTHEVELDYTYKSRALGRPLRNFIEEAGMKLREHVRAAEAD